MANTWAEHTSVTITIKEQGGKVRSYDLDAFVGFSMSEENLMKELHEHPVKFSYVAALHAAAMVRSERLEERLSVKKAELDKKIRTEAANTETRITEEMVKNMIRTHKDVAALGVEYFDAREQEEVLKALRDGLYERLKCMTLVASNYKRERDTDPGTRVDRARR